MLCGCSPSSASFATPLADRLFPVTPTHSQVRANTDPKSKQLLITRIWSHNAARPTLAVPFDELNEHTCSHLAC
jgi:hypothetical protein